MGSILSLARGIHSSLLSFAASDSIAGESPSSDFSASINSASFPLGADAASVINSLANSDAAAALSNAGNNPNAADSSLSSASTSSHNMPGFQQLSTPGLNSLVTYSLLAGLLLAELAYYLYSPHHRAVVKVYAYQAKRMLEEKSQQAREFVQKKYYQAADEGKDHLHAENSALKEATRQITDDGCEIRSNNKQQPTSNASIPRQPKLIGSVATPQPYRTGATLKSTTSAATATTENIEGSIRCRAHM